MPGCRARARICRSWSKRRDASRRCRRRASAASGPPRCSELAVGPLRQVDDGHAAAAELADDAVAPPITVARGHLVRWAARCGSSSPSEPRRAPPGATPARRSRRRQQPLDQGAQLGVAAAGAGRGRRRARSGGRSSASSRMRSARCQRSSRWQARLVRRRQARSSSCSQARARIQSRCAVRSEIAERRRGLLLARGRRRSGTRRCGRAARSRSPAASSAWSSASSHSAWPSTATWLFVSSSACAAAAALGRAAPPRVVDHDLAHRAGRHGQEVARGPASRRASGRPA